MTKPHPWPGKISPTKGPAIATIFSRSEWGLGKPEVRRREWRSPGKIGNRQAPGKLDHRQEPLAPEGILEYPGATDKKAVWSQNCHRDQELKAAQPTQTFVSKPILRA
jgi:hypothetical protein